jgi:hypothetical protein
MNTGSTSGDGRHQIHSLVFGLALLAAFAEMLGLWWAFPLLRPYRDHLRAQFL